MEHSQSDKKFNTISDVGIAMECPYCGNQGADFKSKASQWECRSCERRFTEADLAVNQRLSDKAANPKKIFFSYGHDDNRELVKIFKADLEKRGHTIWFDAKDIDPLSDWKGSITRGIDRSHMAIAFLSKHGLRVTPPPPHVCLNEIALALNRFGTIYPVVLEPNLDDDIPVTIKHLQWPDLSQWKAIRGGSIPGENWERWYEAHLIKLVGIIEGEATHFAGESEALTEVLGPSSFEAKLVQHLEGFVGRQWIFDAYTHWLNHEPQSRIFWLTAGPGVGKTALAANFAARFRGAIVANWFCDAQSIKLRNPDQAIRTLAYQLALRWEDYRVNLLRGLGIAANALPDQLAEVRKALGVCGTQDLFRDLIVEPLANLVWREHKLVVVIDGLDEVTDEAGKNPLTDLIGSQLASLPQWIGFVITSRPDPEVMARLRGFKPFTIDAQDNRNLADLHTWYGERLGKREELAGLSIGEQQRIEQLLIARSEGMILYLKLVEEGLREKSLSVADLDQLESGLPGLNRIYYSSFEHRFDRDYYETSVQPLLRLLVAAGGPLPEDLACEVLGCNSEQFNKVLIRLGSFVVETPAGIELFHKTLKEWLVQKTHNLFYVDPAQGRQQIADVLMNELVDRNVHAVRWKAIAVEWLSTWIQTIRPASLEHFYLAFLNLFDQALTEGIVPVAWFWPVFSWLEYVCERRPMPGVYKKLYEVRSRCVNSNSVLDNEKLTIQENLEQLQNRLQQGTWLLDASDAIKKVKELRKISNDLAPVEFAERLLNLSADLVLSVKLHQEAISLLYEALAIFQRELKADDSFIKQTKFCLVSSLIACGRLDEAEKI